MMTGSPASAIPRAPRASVSRPPICIEVMAKMPPASSMPAIWIGSSPSRTRTDGMTPPHPPSSSPLTANSTITAVVARRRPRAATRVDGGNAMVMGLSSSHTGTFQKTIGSARWMRNSLAGGTDRVRVEPMRMTPSADGGSRGGRCRNERGRCRAHPHRGRVRHRRARPRAPGRRPDGESADRRPGGRHRCVLLHRVRPGLRGGRRGLAVAGTGPAVDRQLPRHRRVGVGRQDRPGALGRAGRPPRPGGGSCGRAGRPSPDRERYRPRPTGRRCSGRRGRPGHARPPGPATARPRARR